MKKSGIVLAVALPEEVQHQSQIFQIPVVFTGVGKVNAAIATTQAIQRLTPSLLINFGTVGGVTQEPDSLCMVNSVIERDMLAMPLSKRGTTPFEEINMYMSINSKGVRCGTGDSFVHSSDPWFLSEGVDIVDMELYAIAKSCYKFNVPWLSYKYVSDSADKNAQSDWQARLSSAFSVFEHQLSYDLESIIESYENQQSREDLNP